MPPIQPNAAIKSNAKFKLERQDSSRVRSVATRSQADRSATEFRLTTLRNLKKEYNPLLTA
jgi:hypothetical protein